MRSVKSLALATLRIVGEEARKERTAGVIAQLPVEVSNYVLNEKRDWIQTIQESNGVAVILVGNPALEIPNYSIRRIRDDETGLLDNTATSYKLVEPKQEAPDEFWKSARQPKGEEAAVSNVIPRAPAPKPGKGPAQAATRDHTLVAEMVRLGVAWAQAPEFVFETLTPRGFTERQTSRRPSASPRQAVARSRQGRSGRAADSGAKKSGNAGAQEERRRRRSRRRRSSGGKKSAHRQAAKTRDPGRRPAPAGQDTRGAGAKPDSDARQAPPEESREPAP